MRWLGLVILWFIAGAGLALAQSSTDNLPSKPARYVSDRAFLLDESTVSALNSQLENFERETSNQLVVAIFANLPPGAEIAQYSTQVFRAWKVGQVGKDNGVVLFIFKDDRKLFIATGRGLEGALPDVICKQIIENDIVPRFRQGDWAGGIQAGVNSIFAATKGEYQGSGRTVQDGERQGGSVTGWIIPLLFLALVIFRIIQGFRQSPQDRVWNRRGSFDYGTSAGFGLGGWGNGGGGSSGFGGGGGGGFSGGGGSSGGGGAGGSW